MSVLCAVGVISKNPLSDVFQGFLFVLDAEVSHANLEDLFSDAGECFDLVAVDVLHRLRPEIALSDLGVEPFGYVVVEVGVPYSGTDEEAFVAGCELAAMDPPVLIEDVDTEDLLGSVDNLLSAQTWVSSRRRRLNRGLIRGLLIRCPKYLVVCVVASMPLPLVSRTTNLSRRFVAVDAVEELRGFVIEVGLIVGGADDRAVSQEGEMPASVLVYLDGIQAGIGGEGFPRHLPHEVVAPFVWTQEDPELAGIDLPSRSMSAIWCSPGIGSDLTAIDVPAGVRRWGWLQPAPSHSLTAEMTRMLSLDLAIDEQDHVFAVAASPGVFLADFDVRLVGREGGGSALAVIDRADIADDDFVDGHDLGLLVLVVVLRTGIGGVSPCPTQGTHVDRCLRRAARRRGT